MSSSATGLSGLESPTNNLLPPSITGNTTNATSVMGNRPVSTIRDDGLLQSIQKL